MYIFVFDGCACNRIFSEFFYTSRSHMTRLMCWLLGGKTVNSGSNDKFHI